MTREVMSECHSISIGFDIAPVGRNRFDFSALTYHAERVSDRVAFLTLFPIGSAMRANLFVYRTCRTLGSGSSVHRPRRCYSA
jgi:hypothetical protein